MSNYNHSEAAFEILRCAQNDVLAEESHIIDKIMTEIDSKKLACVIAKTLDEKLGKNITILNISNVSSLADYFVIVTGDSTPQVKALMNNTKEKIKEYFSRTPIRLENDSKNRWNLLDYGDVIVHILHKEERETYAIEKFWNHAFSIAEDEWREISKEYGEY